MIKIKAFAVVVLVAALNPIVFAADSENSSEVLNNTLQTSYKTQALGQQSQKKIDRLAAETRTVLAEYQKLSQQGDYQRAFNEQLALKQQQQHDEIGKVKAQIESIKMMQQKVQPLLREMALSLATFIQLDLPFQRQQRSESVAKLQQLLADTQVSNSEKYRRVMELFQAENDYNYDMATYRETINLDGQSLSVQLLRIGRSALYFQTLDNQQSGIWISDEKRWQRLDERYQLAIRQGIRMADQQAAPELLVLPVVIRDSAKEG